MGNTITYEVGVEALQNALKAIYDATSAYEQLLEKSTDEVTKGYLIKKITIINDFSVTVVSLLKEMKIQPLEQGTVSGGISRLWFDFKSMVVEHNPTSIIEKAKHVEKEFCDTYLLQLSSGIHSEKVYEILLNQLSEMQGFKYPEVLITPQEIKQTVLF
jgi:rubrerythrin